MLKPFKELLFPVHCFGCNVLGIEICTKCRRHWNSHFYVQRIEGLTVYSSVRYSPVARSILLSAKEESIHLADELIISALLDCLRRIPSSIQRNAILIPVPGSKRAIRRRGRDFILEITRELSLRSGVPMAQGMNVVRTLLDQSGLSAIDRKRNIQGAFGIANDSTINQINGELILVDDLVTTGATLLEAKRALTAQGITVKRAITACVAQTLNIGG